MIPAEITAAWGWRDHTIEPYTGGLINKTFLVRDGERSIAALQQQHPIFAPEVNLDIEAVTTHLASRGLATPRLIRTRAGDAWAMHEGRLWRALTWIDGDTTHTVPSPAWAEAGGIFVGKFHRAVADLRYDYRFTRRGVHDTQAHLERLRVHVDHGAASEIVEIVELGREILAAAVALPPLPPTPLRHVHGDLKISNLIFRRDPLRGVALVDLDTLAHRTMAFELGDAMRSWCNPFGEDAGRARFDVEIFTAAMRGFRSEAATIVSRDEWRAVVVALETVCIELAARFAVDVFEDNYFGWDPARFPTRRAHNLVRAKGQLALGLDVRGGREAALAAVLAE